MATTNKRLVVKEAAQATTQTARTRRGPSVNRVTLIGRLVANPELRYTPNGIAVTSFRIANNGTDEVQYYAVIAWRRLAEVAVEHLAKGRLVYIGGRLTSRTWTGRDGLKRYALEIIASEIQFLSPKLATMRAAA